MTTNPAAVDLAEAEAVCQRLAANDPTLTAVAIRTSRTAAEPGDDPRTAILWVTSDTTTTTATALACNSFVERIDARDVSSMPTELLSALTTLTQLRHLRLQQVGLTVASAKTLLGDSNNNRHWMLHSLETLNLADNLHLGPRGCRHLAEGLRRMPRLRELNLTNVRMGHYGSQALSTGNGSGVFVLPRTLQRLHLGHNAIGPDGLWKLMASELPALTALRYLDLSYNHILDDGCLEIAKHAVPVLGQLVTLRLAGNGIGDTGVTELAKALAERRRQQPHPVTVSGAGTVGTPVLWMEELDLHDNNITDVGATALAELAIASQDAEEKSARDSSSSGEERDDDDDDGETTTGSIPGMIPERFQWKLLNLSKNQIGNVGCNALAQALSHIAAVQIESLNLSHNAIGDEGAGAFVELLDDMAGLIELDLSGNPDLTTARTRILDMLLKHRRHDAAASTEHSETTSRSAEYAVIATVDTCSPAILDNPFVTQLGATERFFQDPQEVEDIMEEGRIKLLECLSSSNCTITQIPFAYVNRLTENFNIERILQYGALGPLYSTTAVEDDCGNTTLFVRHLKLGLPGPKVAARESALQDLIQLTKTARFQQGNLILYPVAYASGQSSYSFVYRLANGTKLTTLADILRDEHRRRKFPWKERVQCLQTVARALAFWHSLDSGPANFHGDVSAHNILFVPHRATDTSSLNDKDTDSDYSNGTFQLTDAGLSRLLATDHARLEANDVIFGSRGYRCPRYERGSCPYNAASDMFSYGMVVAEIATGRLQGSKHTEHARGANDNPEKPSSLAIPLAWDAYYELTGIVSKQPTIPVDSSAGPVSKYLIETLAKILLSCATPVVERRLTSAAVANILGQMRQNSESNSKD